MKKKDEDKLKSVQDNKFAESLSKSPKVTKDETWKKQHPFNHYIRLLTQLVLDDEWRPVYNDVIAELDFHWVKQKDGMNFIQAWVKFMLSKFAQTDQEHIDYIKNFMRVLAEELLKFNEVKDQLKEWRDANIIRL